MAQSGRDDLLQGTLDMLVLKVLRLGAMHGWGITERTQSTRRLLQPDPPAGRRALTAEQDKWGRQSEAVNLVLAMSVV